MEHAVGGSGPGCPCVPPDAAASPSVRHLEVRGRPQDLPVVDGGAPIGGGHQMVEAPEKFNSAMTTWQEWHDARWGRLRCTIAEADLIRHLDLDGGPLRILDLAGGDGCDTMRLAARGLPVRPAESGRRKNSRPVTKVRGQCVYQVSTSGWVPCHRFLRTPDPRGAATGRTPGFFRGASCIPAV